MTPVMENLRVEKLQVGRFLGGGQSIHLEEGALLVPM